MSEKVYLGQNASDLDYYEKAPKISRVNLTVDSDHIYTSGDYNGRTLEVSCPWGSQAMADSILAKVSGIEYQPYEASNALLDPATEIGDGITLGGVYSVLAQSYISLDKQCAANISAPYTDEIDDEYPYKTPEQRKAERQLAHTRSLITKTAEEIKLEVQGLDGKYTKLYQTVDGFTFEDESGTVYIDGGAIKANGVTADQIDATNLKVDAANITGTLYIGDLVDDVGLVTEDNVTTITNNAIKTASISADQITAGTLDADNISIDGLFAIYYGSRLCGKIGGMYTVANGEGAVLTGPGNGAGYVRASASGAKVAYDTYEIGCSSGAGCFSTNTIVVSSDKRLKKAIKYDMDAYENVFMSLKPCSFLMKNESNEQRHWGFIAQDVIAGVKNSGLDADKLAVIAKRNGLYSIGYTEITALNTHMIQKLMARVERLEGKSWMKN